MSEGMQPLQVCPPFELLIFLGLLTQELRLTSRVLPLSLSSYHPNPSLLDVHIADECPCPVRGSGIAHATFTMPLHDVLYGPGFPTNLLSISAITKALHFGVFFYPYLHLLGSSHGAEDWIGPWEWKRDLWARGRHSFHWTMCSLFTLCLSMFFANLFFVVLDNMLIIHDKTWLLMHI